MLLGKWLRIRIFTLSKDNKSIKTSKARSYAQSLVNSHAVPSFAINTTPVTVCTVLEINRLFIG